MHAKMDSAENVAFDIVNMLGRAEKNMYCSTTDVARINGFREHAGDKVTITDLGTGMTEIKWNG